MKYRLSQAIAKIEGFVAGGTNRPSRDHNPGDLRHAPHAIANDRPDGSGIAIEPDDQAGWADLDRQLERYAGRGMTVRAAIEIYAPPNENDSARYLAQVCEAMKCRPETLVSDALRVPAA